MRSRPSNSLWATAAMAASNFSSVGRWFTTVRPYSRFTASGLALELRRVEDVKVIGYAAVCLDCGVEMVEECLRLVAVAEIVEREAETEVLGCLVLVATFGMQIIHMCSDAYAPVHVSGENAAQAVLGILLVAAEIVGEEGSGHIYIVELLLGESRDPV